MKKTSLHIAALTIILLWGSFSAYAFTIRGFVSDIQNGQALAGHPVQINSISHPQGGYHYQQILFTDANGYYADSIALPPQGNPAYIVQTYDCNGLLHHQTVLPLSDTVQVDFQLCTGTPTPCQALFAYQPHPVNKRRIFFTDLSIGSINQWQWDFGDGTSSGMKNPQHTYSQAGMYEVCLTVSHSDTNLGCISTLCDSVAVDLPGSTCQADFNWVPDPGQAGLIHFADQSIGNIVQWLWDFGDGMLDTLPNPSHFYQTPGTFEVCLYVLSQNPVTQQICTDYICKMVQVDSTQAPCQADFIFWPSHQDPFKFIFQFTGSGNIQQWDWDFGDGGSGTGPIIDHIFPDTGSYSVCLIVQGNACADTICKTVDVVSPGHFNLAGQVFAGFFPSRNASVQLFRKIEGQFTLVETTTVDSFGVYFFYQVLGGEYILRARPEQQPVQGPIFIPSYFISSHHWFMADPILLNQDFFGADIILSHHPPGQHGSGQIHGRVMYSANRDDSLQGPAPDIDIFLLNQGGMPMAMERSDAQGYFSFSQVNFGNFAVHAEVPGVQTIPAQVSLNASHPVSDSILLEIQPMLVLPVRNQRRQDGFISEVFPNPAKEEAFVSIDFPLPSRLDFRLLDIQGKLQFTMSHPHPGGEKLISLPLGQLSGGLYILEVSPESGLPVYRKFIRQSDE